MDAEKLRSAARIEYLASLSAREMIDMLKVEAVTPAEAIEVCEARRVAVDDKVCSTPIECFARAKKCKVKSDSLLRGLPVLIKGLSPVQGVAHTEGFFGVERLAETSGAAARAVEAKGGVIVGVTNVPEFGAGAQCFNNLFPTTATPYDLRRTSGGSSGGAAAALASRQCWLATGSDLGGSLRTPAAFCGVVGMRPSPGLVPRDDEPPALPGDLRSIEGPMARNVGDLGLLLDVMAGTDTFRAAAEDRSQLRFRVALSKFKLGVAPATWPLLGAAAASLGEAVEVDEPWPAATTRDCFYKLRAAKFKSNFAERTDVPFDKLKPEIQWNIRAADTVDVDEARRVSTTVAAAVDAFFEKFDVLVCPATLDVPFDKTVRYPVSDYGDNAEPFGDYMEWLAPTYLVSMTNCPALVLPCGAVDDQPVGVQLVAAPGKDAVLVRAAAEVEAKLDLPFRKGIAQPVTAVKKKPPGTGPTSADDATSHHDKRAPL